jgi:metal-responsive CopG/Arc/MetJ family transcriptional regulator
MASMATKVTLTLPDDLLQVVDRFVAEHPGATRSGVCAGALRAWLQREQEAEIERYYAERTAEEQADDEAWTAIASSGAGRLWP